jgi:hypothetical protein
MNHAAESSTEVSAADTPRASSVKGPDDDGEGVIGECLDFANISDGTLQEGDELNLEHLIDVLDGTVLSADVVSGQPSDDICEKLGLDAHDFGRKLVFRARVRADPAGAEKPRFRVLIRQTSEPKNDDWVPVCSSIESRLRTGDAIHVFELYYQAWDGLWCITPEEAIPVVEEDSVEVLANRNLNAMLDKYQSRVDAVEGVVVIDEALGEDLVGELMSGMRRVVDDQSKRDYHPGTRDVVLDIVHPSLFPYVRGVSKLKDGASLQEVSAGSDGRDFWGRPYEESRFQWLPSIFSVSSDGHTVSIKSYINNLGDQKHKGLYATLEKLFAAFVPHFEEVYSYIKAVTFHGTDPNEDIMDVVRSYEPDLAGASLRGRDLKVITKVVSYELREGSEFDGVWHVEGMSHENIVATGLYILGRDEGFEGGDLLFKRAFLDFEASHIFSNVPQTRHASVENWIEGGLVPLGRTATPKGRLIVFPNSHVHKLSKMFRADSSTKEVVTRTIIVFWLVNPEDDDMVTTCDIGPQQTVMALDDALKYRLELMEERKRHKQDWNVREIELCEH